MAEKKQQLADWWWENRIRVSICLKWSVVVAFAIGFLYFLAGLDLGSIV
ncbi:hypothetical protein HZA57_03500 [Candidatus Poribacteria bacterium]|nr:hypothetical protein [Candidatus Poribacteria bacterium]